MNKGPNENPKPARSRILDGVTVESWVLLFPFSFLKIGGRNDDFRFKETLLTFLSILRLPENKRVCHSVDLFDIHLGRLKDSVVPWDLWCPGWEVYRFITPNAKDFPSTDFYKLLFERWFCSFVPGKTRKTVCSFPFTTPPYLHRNKW